MKFSTKGRWKSLPLRITSLFQRDQIRNVLKALQQFMFEVVIHSAYNETLDPVAEHASEQYEFV